jgi:hypothetical protein
MEGRVKAIIMTPDGKIELEGKLDSSKVKYGLPVFISDEGKEYEMWEILEFKGVGRS